MKVIREKYRLCWKEIYLKLKVLTMDTEHCLKCRQHFQLSDMANCRHDINTDLEHLYTDETRLKRFDFHEIDYKNKEILNNNGLREMEYYLFKTQLQVVDNFFAISKETMNRINNKEQDQTPLKLKKETSEMSNLSNDEIVDPMTVITAKHKPLVEFAEPQSMNYDIKLNFVCEEFLKTSVEKAANTPKNS